MAGKKKRPHRHKTPNRNALCPCGSGRAFKHCCAKKRRAADAPDSIPNQLKRIAFGLVVLLAGAGIALAVLRPWEGGGDESASSPEAWEYNAENDQYWNPDHGHWHAGEPPPPEAR